MKGSTIALCKAVTSTMTHSWARIVFMTEIAEVGGRMCLFEGRSNLCKVSLSFQSRRQIAYEKSMSQKIRQHLQEVFNSWFAVDIDIDIVYS